MKILVTGGIGFIGSHVSERLLNEGHSVLCIDNYDPYYSIFQKQQNLKLLQTYSSFSFIEADICHLEELSKIIHSDIDCILHLAAKAGVRPSIEDPVSYQRVNIIGTQNLLEIAKTKGIKSFIFASSSSVYGTNENVPWSEDESLLRPISPYASSKLSAELVGHVYSHLYGIRFIGLRFFTVYGPRQRPDLAIHSFYKKMKSGQKIQLFGDGTTMRDYTFIGDIVEGIMNALDYSKSNYEIINLGNNHMVTLNELVQTLEEVSGYFADKEYLGEQAGDVPITWANISKAQDFLNYQPSTKLADGLKAFTKWYDDHH